jgi:3'(2'), 5'-bisphosphate nucleotidase
VTDDAQLARTLADAAGAELLRIREDPALQGAALKAAGDAGAQRVLAGLLARHRPDDAVLSEEAAETHGRARLDAERVWIVDPLDGTREYSERPRTDWAVHVALWRRGDLVAGAVALPARGLTYATDEPPAVPASGADDGGAPVRLAVSRSRPPSFTAALAEELGAELVPMGSAGVKCASVWTGEADAYVHAGGQYEWDSAAPVAVARAAGLHTSRVDGSPLEYNGPDPLLPDLVVCRPTLADLIIDAAARHTQHARSERRS